MISQGIPRSHAAISAQDGRTHDIPHVVTALAKSEAIPVGRERDMSLETACKRSLVAQVK